MIELAIISTEMLVANLLLWDRCAKRRYSLVTTLLSYVAFRLAMMVLGTWIKSSLSILYSDGPFIILAGFVYVFPIFLLYETKILKLVNVFFFLWVYTFSLYCISYFFSLFFNNGAQMTVFAAIQTVLYSLTFYYYYAILIPKYSYMIDHISGKDELWFSALSTSWFLILFAIYLILVLPDMMLTQALIFILFLAIVALSSRLIYSLVVTKNEMHQLELRFNHQLAQYQEQKRHVTEIRKLSHDINKYNAVIQYALKEKDYDYLAEYCASAFENLRPAKLFQEIGNETIDALNYHLSNQCAEKEIALTLILDPALNNSIEIEPINLTTVLGNLYENAIEACEMVEVGQRWITVEIQKDGERIRVAIKNACTKLEKDNRHGMKRLLPKHIGRNLVEQTVKKLGGLVKHSQKDNRYEVVLIMANRDLNS